MKIILSLLLTLSAVTTMAANIPDGNYAVDITHANVGFSVSHLGISNVIGRFNTFSGNMNFVSGGDSSVNFTIDADSIDTNQSRRDDHLRGDDFFEVETYPKITFASTAVTYDQNGDPATIKGDLSLHGFTNAVTFNVKVVGKGEFPQGTPRGGYVAETVINRTDYGMDTFIGVVGEEVTITVNLEIIKQ